MGQEDLEAPFRDGKPDWDSLYRARGDEVSASRPIFTGDVFSGIELPGRTGSVKPRSVMVLQHPCSMRTDGVNLAPRLLVAEVSRRKPLEEHEWQGNVNVMPLPALRPEITSTQRDQAADFDNLHTVESARLTERIACLSPAGINLLLQRWMHFSSRLVVPTYQFHEVGLPQYEEADLVEEWCDERGGLDSNAAARECVEWLREETELGSTRQEMLEDPQNLSTIRRALREELKRLGS